MNYIYYKKVNYDFLLQAVKIIHTNKNDKSELDIVYQFILQLSEETLKFYITNCTILTYKNDLELFLELIDNLIKIYESDEYQEYEKCYMLLKKKEYTLNFIENYI